MKIDRAIKVGDWGEVVWDFSDLEWFLKYRYGYEISDIEITETPGYWQIITPCDGIGKCRNPIHQTIFNNSGIKHTVRYLDESRGADGRFTTPYKTWRLWKSIEETP